MNGQSETSEPASPRVPKASGSLDDFVRKYSWTEGNRYLSYKTLADEIAAAAEQGLNLVPPDELVEWAKTYYTACPEGFRVWRGGTGRYASEYGYPLYLPNAKGEAQPPISKP